MRELLQGTMRSSPGIAFTGRGVVLTAFVMESTASGKEMRSFFILLAASGKLIASTAEELVRLSEEMQRSAGRFKIADSRAGLVVKK